MRQSLEHQRAVRTDTASVRRRSWAEPAAVAAPMLLFCAWLTLWPLHGRRSPGPGWEVGHASWIAGLAALAIVVAAVRHRLLSSGGGRRALVEVATALALLGLAARTAQLMVDLVAGWRSDTPAELDRMSESMTSAPALGPLLHAVGPVLVPIGLVALTGILAQRRLTTVWTPLLVLVGLACLTSTVTVLAPVGLVTLAVGLLFAVIPGGDDPTRHGVARCAGPDDPSDSVT